MQLRNTLHLIMITATLGGCAGLDFGDQGLSFYEPKPYLFVSINNDCVSTATIASLPGEKKYVKFRGGYGSSELSIALSNGILTNAGQKTDTKIPDTVSSIANIASATASFSENKETKKILCNPSAILYPIEKGAPNTNSPIEFPVKIAN